MIAFLYLHISLHSHLHYVIHSKHQDAHVTATADGFESALVWLYLYVAIKVVARKINTPRPRPSTPCPVLRATPTETRAPPTSTVATTTETVYPLPGLARDPDRDPRTPNIDRSDSDRDRHTPTQPRMQPKAKDKIRPWVQHHTPRDASPKLHRKSAFPRWSRAAKFG